MEAASAQLGSVEDERRAIAASQFEAERFGTLDAYRAQIRLLSDKCERMIETRQSTIQTHRGVYSIGEDPDGFFEYVYEPYESKYPVLYLCTDVARGLQSTYDRIVLAIIGNV